MTKYIQTGDFHIHPMAGQVWYNGETVKIRPKTFELLLLLVEARGELVSKQEILREIWDDVSVDEQVVFQSVKELRKVFGAASVIKTVPRKGYAWALAVEPCDQEGQSQQLGHGARREHTAASGWRLRHMLSAIGGLVLLLVFVMTFFSLNEDKIPPKTGAVIVLPVANSLSDTDHRWVRYGAMDHLIHRLPASDTYGVYQAGDVLDVVKRAGITHQLYSRADIARIFAVTGATLVVEVTLAGTPREYQLVYRLHERGGMEKGALLADRVYGGLDQLATIITQKVDRRLVVEDSAYSSDFANEMIATALELIQTEDFSSAEKFLVAATATEPDNIVAKRLLAQALVSQNKSSSARSVLEAGLKQARDKGNRQELLRLNYWAGIDRMRNREWQLGLDFMEQAAVEAEALKDWLYLGYIAEFKGHAQRAMGDLIAAEEFYQAAIKHHQVIQCPYGQAQGLLNLARVSLELDEMPNAVERTRAALRIIEDRDLHSLEQTATDWMAVLEVQRSEPES